MTYTAPHVKHPELWTVADLWCPKCGHYLRKNVRKVGVTFRLCRHCQVGLKITAKSGVYSVEVRKCP